LFSGAGIGSEVPLLVVESGTLGNAKQRFSESKVPLCFSFFSILLLVKWLSLYKMPQHLVSDNSSVFDN